ncbi:MAG: IS21 family transposase [FCB group bacterium]|nr:IS21 family transposase [FCB group bacterium]
MNHILDVLHRLRQKQSVRSITRDTGISRKTVVSYRDIALANGWLAEQSNLPTREELGDYLTKKDLTNYPPQNISSVEPYRADVERMLRRNYTMKRIFVLLRENFGYNGSYSSVHRFCNKINPPASQVTCRVITTPGEMAQVDFGTVTGNFEGNNRKPLYVLVMTLCYSRHMYVEFVEDQKVATFIRCHVNAFNFFGGVPGMIVPDNLKAAVIEASFTDPVLSEAYRCCARHYGFRISPTNPYTPQHKGKVESGVKYVKKAYCDGRHRLSPAELNRSVRSWCMKEAGTRIHGTTKEQPMILFKEEEREALEKLPVHSYEILVAKRLKLSRDCHLEFSQNYYSAPYKHVGQQLEVYADLKLVRIYKGTELLTTHERCYGKGETITREEHYPHGKRIWYTYTAGRCLYEAEQIGDSCLKIVRHLLSDKVQDRLSSVRNLVLLRKEYGKDRVDAACRRVLHYDDIRYVRIKQVLKQGADIEPPEKIDRLPATRSSYEYIRRASDFFTEVAE